MKNLVFALAVVVAGASLADGAATLTPEERAAKRKAGLEKRIAQSGGWLEKKAEGKVVRLVDAQTTAGRAAIDAAAASIKQVLQFSTEVVAGEAGKAYRPDAEAGVVVSLVDTDDGTTLLVAPEQAWVVINTKALAKDGPAPEVLAERVQKEVWRGLAIAMGASNSMMQPCVMRQINTLGDLDGVKTLVPCPEPFNAMISASTKLGVGRTYRTTYRKACKEGWAPQPTNDAQRVIWEEYHAAPTEPIKIKFDPAKGI